MEIMSLASVTLLVISRDHSEFVTDLVESIEREFPISIPLVWVDVGSVDGTLHSARTAAHFSGRPISFLTINRDSVSLDALAAATGLITTDYVSVISADDAFGLGYARALSNILNCLTSPCVVNFDLTITNSQLIKVGSRTPNWTSSATRNRKALLRGNPGTAPGCVLPWRLLVSLPAWSDRPNSLIEDYWLWWMLIGKADFLVPNTGSVLYRQHPANLSKRRHSSSYIASLGYSVGLANSKVTNLVDRINVSFLLLRWIRHVPLRLLPDFLRGFLTA